MINRERALDYLNTKQRLYVMDGFAGWDPDYQIKVRIVTTRAYHALFMNNMLIRPTAEQLETFGEPDYVIFNAGEFSANRHTTGMTSKTSVGLHFGRKEAVILGTQYAGEMKKGVFTIMHYLMPQRDVLSMHCSANEGTDGDVSIFFGLSGTGKTTLSADPHRNLIGDDEHCWTANGVFNIEGGCYAKAIRLSADDEPEIYNAIRFGSVLENVVYDDVDRSVDYDNDSITQNTRCSYPIEYIPNAKIPCTGGHPKNVILLTCDAFGVLPTGEPTVSRASDVPLHQRVHGEGRRYRDGRDRARGHLQCVFRRSVPGVAPGPLRGTPRLQAPEARGHDLAREHRLDGRSVRRRQADEHRAHPRDHRRNPLGGPRRGQHRRRPDVRFRRSHVVPRRSR